MNEEAKKKKDEANNEMARLMAKGADNVTQEESQRVNDLYIDSVLAMVKR
jgi:hypothetical protein